MFTCSLLLHFTTQNQQKKSDYISFIKQKLSPFYFIQTIYISESKQQTIDYAYILSKHNDILIFNGGDGTFHDVVNGVMKGNPNIKLGYLPSGTCNDMAHNLGISKNLNEALTIILEGKTQPLHLFTFENKYASYVLGLGLLTSIGYQTKATVKYKWGRFAYFLAGLKDLLQNNQVELKLSNSELNLHLNTPLLLIMNTKYIGKFKVNPDGFRNDDTFDIFILKNSFPRRWQVIRFLLHSMLFKKVKNYTHIQTSEIEVTLLSPSPWCVDGEKYTAGTLKIKQIQTNIKVYTNQKKP